MTKLKTRIVSALCILPVLFSMIGCGKKQPEEATSSTASYYRPDEGEYISPDITAGVRAGTKEEAEAKGKTIITLVDAIGETGIIGHIVNGFNKENDQYYVEFQTMDTLSISETRDRLKMDLASGKGPDMLTWVALPDAYKILSSGCFADLSEFLTELNVTDDSFLPAVKALTCDNKVYGICVDNSYMVTFVKESVLGGQTVPAFSEFIDMLLTYPENAILYNEYQPSSVILEIFLEPSESLRGTVDKANKTCDFTGELFSKLLDVCKRYGDVRDKGYEPVMMMDNCVAGFYPGESLLRESGWVTVNTWFDDGNSPQLGYGAGVMVNSATQNMDGVKVFLSYVLSPQGQSLCTSGPVNRSVFKSHLNEQLTMYKEGRTVSPCAITEDVIAEISQNAQKARYAPYDNSEILDIILEETEPFFAGEKTKEEVIGIIQNRVQIMLDERNN